MKSSSWSGKCVLLEARTSNDVGRPPKNITVGYLVSPFGLDNITSSGNMTFMEPASPVQAFAPGNRMALQLDGNWRDQRMSYQAGLFAVGQSTKVNFGDASEGLARVMGRITGLPIYVAGEGEYQLLHPRCIMGKRHRRDLSKQGWADSCFGC